MAREEPQIIPPELLLRAYRAGIFPMADSRVDPEIYWVEPRMRAILPLNGFHLSRSLARTLRRGRFHVTCNQAFDSVIDHCAAPRPDAAESWISGRIRESYRELHRIGAAHSIETWISGPDGTQRLVGGLYGVGFARVFCGESMFARVPDASKVALAWLVGALVPRDGGWLRTRLAEAVATMGRHSLEVFCLGLFLSYGVSTALRLWPALFWPLDFGLSALGVLVLMRWARFLARQRVLKA